MFFFVVFLLLTAICVVKKTFNQQKNTTETWFTFWSMTEANTSIAVFSASSVGVLLHSN